MARVCTTVEHYRGPILTRWVLENPRQARQLLDGLRFAAFGLPDAARLVVEIERLLERVPTSEGALDKIVEVVVREIGRGVEGVELD